MSSLANARRSMGRLEELSRRDTFLNRVHPVVKLLVTLSYLVAVVSFRPEMLTGVLAMALYPYFVFEISDLSFKDALYRLRAVLPLVCIVGILNPFFDREPVLTVFGITLTGGILTMLSLMVKGVLTVLASYLLAATTPVSEICGALRMLHVPGILVTEFLLICRYVGVLLQETDRMWQAYTLRAPGQKGLNIRVWGPMIGRLLLRSMDRAEIVWQSMCLRGYRAEISLSSTGRMKTSDWLIVIIFPVLFLFLRVVPVLELAGRLFT